MKFLQTACFEKHLMGEVKSVVEETKTFNNDLSQNT